MSKGSQRNGSQSSVPFLYRFLADGEAGYINYLKSIEDELIKLLETRVAKQNSKLSMSILNYGVPDNFFSALGVNEERFEKEKWLEKLVELSGTTMLRSYHA
jgi:hypothetical protein